MLISKTDYRVCTIFSKPGEYTLISFSMYNNLYDAVKKEIDKACIRNELSCIDQITIKKNT